MLKPFIRISDSELSGNTPYIEAGSLTQTKHECFFEPDFCGEFLFARSWKPSGIDQVRIFLERCRIPESAISRIGMRTDAESAIRCTGPVFQVVRALESGKRPVGNLVVNIPGLRKALRALIVETRIHVVVLKLPIAPPPRA